MAREVLLRMSGNGEKIGVDYVIHGSNDYASNLESAYSKGAQMPDLLFMLEDRLGVSKKLGKCLSSSSSSSTFPGVYPTFHF